MQSTKIVGALLFLLLFSFVARAQTAAQEKFATVFGAKIRYVEAGDATKPAVVLLHGLGANAETWRFNIGDLSQKYHVIAPDQIGFGKSDKPIIAYRVETYVDFLDKFLGELKIEKATLVGNSLGGWIAAWYALKNPTKVEKLVLVDAAGYSPPKDFDVKQLDNLNPSTREGTRALTKLVFFDPKYQSDFVVDTLMTARIAAGDGYTIQAITESIKRGEGYLDDKLNGIKSPTLVIWGKQDGLVTLANGERFKREIQGAQLVVIDSCGHAPQVEKAVDFNAALLKFLEGK